MVQVLWILPCVRYYSYPSEKSVLLLTKHKLLLFFASTCPRTQSLKKNKTKQKNIKHTLTSVGITRACIADKACSSTESEAPRFNEWGVFLTASSGRWDSVLHAMKPDAHLAILLHMSSPLIAKSSPRWTGCPLTPKRLIHSLLPSHLPSGIAGPSWGGCPQSAPSYRRDLLPVWTQLCAPRPRWQTRQQGKDKKMRQWAEIYLSTLIQGQDDNIVALFMKVLQSHEKISIIIIIADLILISVALKKLWMRGTNCFL